MFMSLRIAVLEDALHAQCGEAHPLLAQSLQSVRARIYTNPMEERGLESNENEIVEDLGATLIIDGDAHRYIGSQNTEVGRCFD